MLNKGYMRDVYFKKHFISKMFLISYCIFFTICVNNVNAGPKMIFQSDSSSIIDDIKSYSKKDNFFSKALKSIVVVESDTMNKTKKFDKDSKIIKKYSGKYIRNIDVEILDVFGANVDNPDDSVRGWFENIGNSLHSNSKKWLIKDMLIFSEGEKLTLFNIEESERIIRQYPYIFDVRILPKYLPDNRDSVDIIIYVQDIWSINGGGSLSFGNNTASLYANDLNFLGFGNEFSAGIKIDKKYINDWDWDGSYTVNNIGSTYIMAKLLYESEYNNQHYGLMLSRDFISPVINWGGGIAQHWQHTRYPDTIMPVIFTRFNQQDYWLGYSFNKMPQDTNINEQNSYNLAGRITRTIFNQKPTYDSLHHFQNNILYLARVGFSDIIYYKDHFIFGLGITEDVPLLKMIELIFGYESGEISNSPYFGIKTGYSFLTNDDGYIYSGLQIGSFFREKELQNLTTNLEFLYFSKLNFIGNWKWRHYIGSRLSYIYNPATQNEILNINENGGLRGFSEEYLQGNKKLIINYEADFFVPLTLFGFKLAIITFADIGLIAPNNNSLISSKLFQGYGIGIRIKNEHLIFPTMQFMLGYYPNSEHTNDGKFNIFYQSEMFYRFNKFQFSSPSVVSFDN